ncbi:MAG: hypothetical protein JWO51_93 [Rhodospirillales bacterium]|nr:hypothetical protein [Rhodospirillales bacterium]
MSAIPLTTAGGYPVPWTVSWSGEERFFIAPCRFADGMIALCQDENPGVGRPMFAKPHSVRQRHAMARQLCDLCGKALQGHTKVSLSQESPRDVPTLGFVPLAVEPMMHRACAVTALNCCPNLRQQQLDGILRIRQVQACSLVAQLLNADATLKFAGVAAAGAVGHMKLAITRYIDRGAAWLGQVPP